MLFIPILLGVISLALFILNSQMGLLLAEAINFGTTEQIYVFGGIWLGLLGISIILAVASIKEFIEYNENRPRKPLRNR
jgi:hypothetical protein